VIGDANSHERPGALIEASGGGDVRQTRSTREAMWRHWIAHNATVRSPATELSSVLQLAHTVPTVRFRVPFERDDRSQRSSNLLVVHHPWKGGDVGGDEGDEDDNRPPYTLWTCRLRTGCRCKSLSINTLSEDDKGYF